MESFETSAPNGKDPRAPCAEVFLPLSFSADLGAGPPGYAVPACTAITALAADSMPVSGKALTGLCAAAAAGTTSRIGAGCVRCKRYHRYHPGRRYLRRHPDP